MTFQNVSHDSTKNPEKLSGGSVWKLNFPEVAGISQINPGIYEYTGFLLYCGPYLLTGKCKCTKSKSDIYLTSVPWSSVPFKICPLKM